jgi:hypothetical protein
MSGFRHSGPSRSPLPGNLISPNPASEGRSETPPCLATLLRAAPLRPRWIVCAAGGRATPLTQAIPRLKCETTAIEQTGIALGPHSNSPASLKWGRPGVCQGKPGLRPVRTALAGVSRLATMGLVPSAQLRNDERQSREINRPPDPSQATGAAAACDERP